jgi:hypothetical protein
MPFVLTFPWRAFVLAMRDRDRANENEIAIFVFSITTKHFPHDMLLPRLIGSMLPRRVFHHEIFEHINNLIPRYHHYDSSLHCIENASQAARWPFFHSDSLVGFDQVQLRYFSRRVKSASNYPDGRGSSLFWAQSVPGHYRVSQRRPIS